MSRVNKGDELYRHPKTGKYTPIREIEAELTKKEFRAFKKKEGLGFFTQLFRFFFGNEEDSQYDTMYDDPR